MHKQQEKPVSETKTEVWFELFARKDEFQRILKLLVEFNERINPQQDMMGREGHFCRKAISVALDPENDIRVFMMDKGASLYLIIAELKTFQGNVVTAWHHEDGIFEERKTLSDNPDHPVHSIVCMTDLFRESARPIEDKLENILGMALVMIMPEYHC